MGAWGDFFSWLRGGDRGVHWGDEDEEVEEAQDVLEDVENEDYDSDSFGGV